MSETRLAPSVRMAMFGPRACQPRSALWRTSERMNAMDMTFPAATSAIPAAPEDRERRPIDRALRAAIGRLSGGLSVTSLSAAYANWFIHLLGSPGKQQQL